MRILLADDDDNARTWERLALESRGHTVETAADGAEALEKAKRFPPDLIISDVLMPEVDGFALCHTVKTDPNLKDIPFVFYTATYTEQEDRRFAFDLGAARYIVKPLEMTEFLDAIDGFLGELGDGRPASTPAVRLDDEAFEEAHRERVERKLDEKVRELEEKQAALKTNEERLKLALEATNDGLWDWNIETGDVYFSPRWQAMLGFAFGEVVPRWSSWEGRIHKDDRLAALRSLEEHLEGKTPSYESEHRLRSKSGEWTWVLARGKVVARDSAGKALRVLGTHADVGERKRHEAKIARAHEAQRLINSLLALSLKPLSLQEQLQEGLQLVLSAPWYPIVPRGCIFLLSGEQGPLEMVAQQGLSESLQTNCSQVEMGDCLCGRAALSRELVFATDTDVRHENSYAGAEPHGHYCVPLMADDALHGVLNVYLSAPHQHDPDEEQFLSAVAHALAGIIERKRAEQALKASDARFRALYDDNPAMFFAVDGSGAVVSVNAYGAQQLGYSVEELTGARATELYHLDDRAIASVRYREALQQFGRTHQWELRRLRKGGGVLWVRETGRAVEDASGQRSLLIVSEDISEVRTLSEHLVHQATHDALTGLVNRREFEKRLARVLRSAEAEGEEHALCYLDLDQFKVINDTFGHAAGDAMLHQLGSVLREKVRKRDTLARLGGDEFGVLMERCSLDQAHRVARAMQRAVEGFRFPWQGCAYQVGVSIGLVPIGGLGQSITTVLQQADSACYSAKEMGRNRICVFEPEAAEVTRRRGEMQWVHRIGTALEEGRFELYAQPIVPVRKGIARSEAALNPRFELLLRMQDSQGRLIMPEEFMGAAERYNLATKLDRWTIDSALRCMADSVPKRLVSGFCTINLSGQSLGDEEFLHFVVEQLDASGMPGSRIGFEVTETAAVTNLPAATRFFYTLKDRGCFFALDDFGAGMSSFTYLKSLPVDLVKIDGAFVRDIAGDPVDLAMVRSINDIGHVMGKQTVAEFVESEATLNKLREVGVDYVQGFYLGVPRPVREILPLLDTESE